MSTSKGSKRISVFDRLGPGAEEVRGDLVELHQVSWEPLKQSSPSHRRYSSEKHTSSSGGPEKGRGHTFGAHAVRMEDRETPPSRDRKTR